jgi:hypothetical protein
MLVYSMIVIFPRRSFVTFSSNGLFHITFSTQCGVSGLVHLQLLSGMQLAYAPQLLHPISRYATATQSKRLKCQDDRQEKTLDGL